MPKCALLPPWDAMLRQYCKCAGVAVCAMCAVVAGCVTSLLTSSSVLQQGRCLMCTAGVAAAVWAWLGPASWQQHTGKVLQSDSHSTSYSLALWPCGKHVQLRHARHICKARAHLCYLSLDGSSRAGPISWTPQTSSSQIGTVPLHVSGPVDA